LTPGAESGSNDAVPGAGEGQWERRTAPRGRGARYGENAGADERTRQPRGDLRRQQIIDAAVELFAAKGYRGTGVAALADRVGMTATGLLYYFGTKERLLREVVAERDRMETIDPDREFPLALTLSSLRELGRHNVETAILTRLYLVLGAESFDPDDPLHEFFVERYEVAREFVRALLHDEKAQGRVRPEVDVDQVALEVIAMIMGLEYQWVTDPARVDFGRAMERYIDQLIVQLAAGPPADGAASPDRSKTAAGSVAGHDA
jgi:AcrR family transcriptional regulator